MNAMLEASAPCRSRSPFDVDDEAAYQAWRAAKLMRRARCADDLIVEVGDPQALTASEREALLQRCAASNMAVYRSRRGVSDKHTPRALGAQLGLVRLDANWLADEDGISSITVSPARDGRGGFIPYTDRPLKWHTDGYYHPQQQRIRAMLLHCARPAARGGVNRLLDHELAYIALRDASPRWVRALMAADAMTIPAREDEVGTARPAQCGPVFSVDPHDGALHMRYTARTRSIEWKDDAATRDAVAFVERLLAEHKPDVIELRLDAGMGIVANNVLHDRSAFVDDPSYPRLIYRARYLDRIADPARQEEPAWRNG
jgi:Taurine catabolism dioxygenase TauD, TfdA family